MLTMQIAEVVPVDFSSKRVGGRHGLVVEGEGENGGDTSPKPEKVCPDVDRLVVALEERGESRVPG